MLETALHGAHVSLKASMGAFAGYDMPLFYSEGVIKEGLWTRSNASAFDVSHMGLVSLVGKDATELLETISPSAYKPMRNNALRYSAILLEDGGILDDFIIMKQTETSYVLVINASRKQEDIAYISETIKARAFSVQMELLSGWGIVAVQGPMAQSVLEGVLETSFADTYYSDVIFQVHSKFGTMIISRSGYTGEDGFEVAMSDNKINEFWQLCLSNPDCKPAGLAARDILRMEAGYPLYGLDLSEKTDVFSAKINWIVSPNNTSCVALKSLQKCKAEGTKTRRTGLVLSGNGMMRSGQEVLSANGAETVGIISSACFSQTLGCSIAQVYLDSDFTEAQVFVKIRGVLAQASVRQLPFIADKLRRRPVAPT